MTSYDAVLWDASAQSWEKLDGSEDERKGIIAILRRNVEESREKWQSRRRQSPYEVRSRRRLTSARNSRSSLCNSGKRLNTATDLRQSRLSIAGYPE